MKVKVNSVKAEELPELNDEFAEKLPSSTLWTSSRLTFARLPLRTPKSSGHRGSRCLHR